MRIPAFLSLLIASQVHAATLSVYLPFDGDTAAGGTTSVGGTVIGTNGTPGDNFTIGKFGMAGSFSNTNTTVATPNDWAVSVGNQDAIYASSFSVSIWVQTTTVGYTADKGFFGNKNWSSGANVGWTLSTVSSTGGGGRVNWNSTGGTRKDPNIAFNTGDWNLVAVVFDRENNLVERFLDGTSLGVTASAFTASGAGNLGAGFNTLIGASGNGTYGANSVRLDDVAIWSGKLTSNEVAALWNGGAGNLATAVPEPSVPFIGGLGVLLLARHRRRSSSLS